MYNNSGLDEQKIDRQWKVIGKDGNCHKEKKDIKLVATTDGYPSIKKRERESRRSPQKLPEKEYSVCVVCTHGIIAEKAATVVSIFFLFWRTKIQKCMNPQPRPVYSKRTGDGWEEVVKGKGPSGVGV